MQGSAPLGVLMIDIVSLLKQIINYTGMAAGRGMVDGSLAEGIQEAQIGLVRCFQPQHHPHQSLGSGHVNR